MKFVPLRYRFCCHVGALCLLWYFSSTAASIINKVTLQKYPYPMTVALVSLCTIPVYAVPLLWVWHIKKQNISDYYMYRYVIPISAAKAIAVACAYFSLWKVPVSYAHTVKATMPLFAVLCARIVLKEKQTFRIYLSLAPIIAGVLIASFTELSFSLSGLISSLCSTATYSLLNVYVKRVLKDTEVHPIRFLILNAQIAASVFFPFWLIRDGVSLWTTFFGGDQDSHITPPDVWFLIYLALSGLLSFAKNICAFVLIHRLTALSYAVANATTRITVIAVSLITLHNPVTSMNIFGMGLAIFGVFFYNRAKQSQLRGLPLSRTDATLSDASLIMLNNGDSQKNLHSFLNNSSPNKQSLDVIYMRAQKSSRKGDYEHPRNGHVKFVM
uniref:TPT domain-containing protein n=1 Tax=Syphacia muris TaxID=451379 RepID=A0A0N5ALP8_9BILA